MKDSKTPMTPLARQEGLLVRELMDETLVYDLGRHKAHCLNRTAALVWRFCDGQSSVKRIAERLAGELDTGVKEDVVWLALERLERARLLQGRVTRRERPARYSRREMARRVGLVGGLSLLVPIVTSLVVPTASLAATCRRDAPGCRANGSACTASIQCCSCCCRRSGMSQVCAGSSSGCL